MLSLYKLEIFVTVAKEGSFSRAARRLFMTQPAVSQHIQDLERQLGTSLFERLPRGVELTMSGNILYDYTNRILRLVAEAENAVTDVSNIESGTINIGATPGVSNYLLFDWVRGFTEAYPRLSVSLHTDITSQIVAAIAGRKIDLGFIEGELDSIDMNGLGSLVLEPIPMYVVVNGNHDWTGRDTIAVTELDNVPFITRQKGSRTRVWIDRTLGEHAVKPRIVAELDSPEAIKQAVLSDLGVSILPQYAIKREAEDGVLRALTVENVALQRNLKLIWDRSSPFSPLIRALLQHLVEEFAPIRQLL